MGTDADGSEGSHCEAQPKQSFLSRHDGSTRTTQNGTAETGITGFGRCSFQRRHLGNHCEQGEAIGPGKHPTAK
jgi:hypothetical protein